MSGQPDMLHHARILRAVADLAAEAEGDGQAPLCIAVCDAVGDLLHYTRMAGAKRRGTPIAQAKAYTAAVLETPTSALHARLVREHLSLADFCDGPQHRLTSLVGISGRKPAEDEVLAGRLAAALLGEGGPTARD